MLDPWIGWFKRDANNLEALREATRGEVDVPTYEKLQSDRHNMVEALDEVADRLQALGIDYSDRRNRAMRRAHDALERAFMGWQHISLVLSVRYYAENPDAYDEEARRTTPRMLRSAA